jgi:hypothetical protein
VNEPAKESSASFPNLLDPDQFDAVVGLLRLIAGAMGIDAARRTHEMGVGELLASEVRRVGQAIESLALANGEIARALDGVAVAIAAGKAATTTKPTSSSARPRPTPRPDADSTFLQQCEQRLRRGETLTAGDRARLATLRAKGDKR